MASVPGLSAVSLFLHSESWVFVPNGLVRRTEYTEDIRERWETV